MKTAQTIPDSELWLGQQEADVPLDRAMAVMDSPAISADFDALEQHLGML
jgi:hypothetical protein